MFDTPRDDWSDDRFSDEPWGWNDAAAPDSDVPVPDGLGRVLEVSTMVSVFEADRLRRVAAFHDDALADGEYGVTREIAERSIRLELAAALRITEYAAGELIQVADAVTHRYPAVLDALAGDRVTISHVKVLVTAMDTLEPLLRRELLAGAIELAEAEPVGVFRRKLAARVETARADTLAERHAVAVATRRIRVEPGLDGMATLVALMPALEAHAIYARATRIAKLITAQPGELRTLDQVRADVIADLLIDGHTPAHPKKARGIRAEVVVTVPALSLLDGSDLSKTGVPVVEGVGPIPIDTARRLCGGESQWMRVLTDPETGMVLSVGRTKYSPPKSLQKLTKWRADRCLGPGCTVPASRSQIDHTIAWEDGGCTSLENHGPLCQGHHTIKHHGNWIVRQVPGSGGALEWTSPTGRRYVVEPERRVPTFTVTGDDVAPF